MGGHYTIGPDEAYNVALFNMVCTVFNKVMTFAIQQIIYFVAVMFNLSIRKGQFDGSGFLMNKNGLPPSRQVILMFNIKYSSKNV